MYKAFLRIVGAISVPLAQAVLPAVLLLAVSFFAISAAGQGQKSFSSPEEAVKAMVDAAKAGNTEELLAIFGPEAKELLSSGDPVADRRQREVVLVALGEGWKLVNKKGGTKELIIGNEDWPFPIPLVKEPSGWRFDTAAGKDEILARRVGRNELSVIQVCATYVHAQEVYAKVGHDGKPAGLYAQKIRSEPGRQDGLYWEAKPGEKPSPLGELAAQAAEEGYAPGQNTAPVPFHGYYFHVLTAQGKSAPGGAKSYLETGDLKDGFALVAWPAEYANSGVMTFIINQAGVVYQKDLGEETAKLASQMKDYNPDKTWRKAQ